MNKEFGALMKAARQQHNLDQAELGQLMGLDDATICTIERGNRPLYASELLALNIIFEEWFAGHLACVIESITADIAARTRGFLEQVSFPPEEQAKRHWFGRLLARLDHLYEPEHA